MEPVRASIVKNAGDGAPAEAEKEKNFNLSIQKLFHAIGLELSRYLSIKLSEEPIKGEDLLF